MLAIPGTGTKLRLYCSGEKLDSRCEAMPNFGGENYVSLRHIVDHYDNLADVTVFTVSGKFGAAYA